MHFFCRRLNIILSSTLFHFPSKRRLSMHFKACFYNFLFQLRMKPSIKGKSLKQKMPELTYVSKCNYDREVVWYLAIDGHNHHLKFCRTLRNVSRVFSFVLLSELCEMFLPARHHLLRA